MSINSNIIRISAKVQSVILYSDIQNFYSYKFVTDVINSIY
ncbi:hypothetical protein IHI24_000596 [Rickettsia endosymbiont of Cardiosporidium cionae]|nr:hypothetical protein IHI24_000596 [Rickettsia endosymbiont of Cardiosporidium cionae]